jgi:hypothetical protein
MPKKPKPKRSGKATTGLRRGVSEFRIVIVDQAPLRDAVIRECRRLMRSVEEGRLAVHQFETVSRPAYDRWLASTFGQLLTHRRELGEKISAADALVHEVHVFVMMHGGSLRAAYQRLMREREENAALFAEYRERFNEPNGEPETSAEPPPQSGTDAHETMQRAMFEQAARSLGGFDPAALPKKEYERLFREFQRSFFGHQEDESGDRTERRRRRRSAAEAGESATATQSPKQRLKELYRMLVRRLHPDMRADTDPTVSALWHEVQEAYARGDEQRLETLVALSDVEAGSITASTSLSQLHAVRTDLGRTVQAIRRALGAAKKDPAWKFEEKNLERLAAELTRQLKSQIARLSAELSELESMIESWKQAPRRRRTVSTR